MAHDATFIEQMQALRGAYAERLPERIGEIESAWLGLFTRWDTVALQDLHRAVHNITGSGAVYGFTRVSDAARPLDIFLGSMLGSTTQPTEAQCAQFGILLSALKEAALAPDQSSEPEAASQKIVAVSATRGSRGEKDNGLIYLAAKDATLAHDLTLQVSHFSYQVKSFSAISKLKEAVKTTIPAAILVDVDSVYKGDIDVATMTEIKHLGPTPIPLLFISSPKETLWEC